MVHLYDLLADGSNVIMREKHDRFEVEVRVPNELSLLDVFEKGDKPDKASSSATNCYNKRFRMALIDHGDLNEKCC